MSQLTKPFIKVVTANKVNEVLNTYSSLIENEVIENIIDDLGEDINTLKKYRDDYYYDVEEDVANSIYEYAKENNIYDREIMAVVVVVEKAMKDYEFISILDTPGKWESSLVEKYKKFVNQHLLYRKLYNKENLPNYRLVKVKKKEVELAEIS